MANKTLYAFNYNNYYNRQFKRLNSVGEYLDEVQMYETVELLNFIPGNEINTTQIINSDDALDYNYLIVVDNDDQQDFTRWFIIATERVRKGQYKLQLRRDIVSDYYDDIKQSPFMIEKGYVNNNNPLIFNDEGQIYNKIKTSEKLLMDETKCPWVVGFIPRDAFAEGKQLTINRVISTDYDITVNGIDTWEFNSSVNKINYTADNRSVDGTISFKLGDLIMTGAKYNFLDESYTQIYNAPSGTYPVSINAVNPPFAQSVSILMDDFVVPAMTQNDIMYDNIVNSINYANYVDNNGRTLNNSSTETTYNNLLSYRNKIIFDTVSGDYYRVNLEAVEFETEPIETSNSILTGAKYALRNLSSTLVTVDGYNDLLADNIEINSIYGTGYYLTLSRLAETTYLDIPSTANRMIPDDTPYDIFAIPYSDDLIFKINDVEIKSNKNAALAISSAFTLSDESGSSYLYDVQIMPYCPVRQYISEDGVLDVSLASTRVMSDVYTIDDTGDRETLTKLFWLNSSEFSFDINYSIEVDDYKEGSSLDSYRLCSPNYSGLFEFNAAKNHGVKKFNVDCTYKPYSSYVHVNPDFNGLYGYDFNDARGLIIGGDFSLPIMTSAWTEYELQNKNYQVSFDRSIETMELQKNISIGTSVASSLLGGVSSGIMGGMAGGPAGAIAGGVGSLVGGAIDLGTNIVLANDAIDAAKDQFNYQLGNIQALPQSISKVSSLDANNKLFPFIEYYTCTETEREVFRNKIKYTGMTVMSTGYIEDYLNPDDETFVSASLIRLISETGNYLIASTISEEFRKGLYIRKDDE